jgi:hypothetical protein
VLGSRFEPGSAYVTKSRRRQDDSRSYVFRTTDFGASWTIISDGMDGAANAIVEDTVNRGLLFAGTDIGVFVSFDRGARWWPFKANMPTAPVQDMLIHSREGDLVAGTFGRGVWVTNIVSLREMGGDFLTREAALLPIRPFAQRREGAFGNYRLYGDRAVTTPNEPNAMTIVYYLKEAPQSAPALSISDVKGTLVRKLNAQSRAGINRAVWNLDDAQGRPAPAGEYIVTLEIAGRQLTQKALLVSRLAEAPRGRGGE